jgi:serine/threonine protein kinase
MLGEILLDRYRVEAEIGHGGMGVVYRAHDAVLERDVAVKLCTDKELLIDGKDRLMREARAAGKLNHPNIVSIYDVCSPEGDDEPDGAACFIVMELAEGDTLYEKGTQDLEGILQVAMGVSEGLQHAHQNGIIHRDPV